MEVCYTSIDCFFEYLLIFNTDIPAHLDSHIFILCVSWQSVHLNLKSVNLPCSLTQFCRFTKQALHSWTLQKMMNQSDPDSCEADHSQLRLTSMQLRVLVFGGFWWALRSASAAVRKKTDGGLVKANLPKLNSSISLQHLSFGPRTHRDTCSQE